MKIIKNILLLPFNIIKITLNGFSLICKQMTKGFYFYLIVFFKLIKKIFFSAKIFDKIINALQKQQQEPESFLILLLCAIIIFSCWTLYFDKANNIVDLENFISNDTKVYDDKPTKKVTKNDNLYKVFGNMKLSEINIKELKQTYPNVIAWICVDGTNINYPVVQTEDNDYYLNHDIKNNESSSGWPFLDYRNDELNDSNTIFYGHNLLNKTSFGSVSNIFTDKYKATSNYKIIVITENKIYTYKIFSAYYIEPEVYYLHINFSKDKDYLTFLETLKNRDTLGLNEKISTNDRIITLSTCTDDNTGRKVVHAKLIEEKDI